MQKAVTDQFFKMLTEGRQSALDTPRMIPGTTPRITPGTNSKTNPKTPPRMTPRNISGINPVLVTCIQADSMHLIYERYFDRLRCRLLE